MNKWILWLGAALVAMLALTACGGGENGGSGSAGGADGGGGASGGQVKEFTIDATNFAFDLTEIKVNKGDTVKLTLKNSQGNHALKVEGYDKEVKGGKTISFVADKTGEFMYICSIFCGGGHGDMVGKLIVQ
jgi:Nitrous oxide reductase